MTVQETVRSSPTGSDHKVHVICAPPNGRNPGMTSVDLAFADVAADAGAGEVVYWRLWDQSEWLEPPGGSTLNEDGTFTDDDSQITYRPLRGNLTQALDAPCVVYWGDFLHMAVYQEHTVDVLTRRMHAYSDRVEAAQVVADHLLLRGRTADELERVISFGTTLSFNSGADYAGTYGRDLDALLDGVHRIWLRDLYSAQVAALARRPRDEFCKGVDAALLLESPRQGPRDPSLGVFFGRSALQPEPLALFGSRLCRRLNLSPTWIDWGREPAFWPMNGRKRFRAAWPGLERGLVKAPVSGKARTVVAIARGGRIPTGGPPSTSRLLEQLGACSVVLTDTYHLALNAWRVGTPAICVVDRPDQQWSVNSGASGGRRDKRTDFYSQLDALGLLVDGSTLGLAGESAVARTCDFLDDTASLDVIQQRLAAMTEHSRGALVDAIRSRLGAHSP